MRNLGRKRKNSNEKGLHDKYSQDNIFHRVKYYFLKVLKEFINEKIFEIYSGNIGNGIYAKKLFDINNYQLNNSKISFNIELLNKPIGEIFSNKLNKKYSRIKSEHNINVIIKLKNEQDEVKLEKINKLLNSTFYNCLEHLRGTKCIDGLEGLEKKYSQIFDDLSKKGETEEYFEIIKDMIYNYEKYLNIKKPKKFKKKDAEI